jgi:hypothetical protein
LHHVLNLLYPANSDWERIQNMFNDESWSPENMRSIWERIENNRYNTPPITDEDHASTRYGYNGWATSEIYDLDALEELVGDERICEKHNFLVSYLHQNSNTNKLKFPFASIFTKLSCYSWWLSGIEGFQSLGQ